jgi:hypothetical protein
MQRKQQVGECWVCVIFFACVCVGASDMTTASDDPSSSDNFVSCAPGHFPRGVPGGGGGAGMPPWLRATFGNVRGSAPKFFFWAVFAIFSGFCYF